MILVKQKALHTFGACNASTHPGNNQEFISFKSHFSLITLGTDRSRLLLEQSRFPLRSAAARCAVRVTAKGGCFPNSHILSGLPPALLIHPDLQSIAAFLQVPSDAPLSLAFPSSPSCFPAEQPCSRPAIFFQALTCTCCALGNA